MGHDQFPYENNIKQVKYRKFLRPSTNEKNESQIFGDKCLVCAFVRVCVAVHCGELIMSVILGELIVWVLSTAPTANIWKVVLSPNVTGLYGGTGF